jgi:hypothetical protein
MSNDRVAVLSNENAELKVILTDTLIVLANSTPRPGTEQVYNQLIDRIIINLNLSDDEIRALLGG